MSTINVQNGSSLVIQYTNVSGATYTTGTPIILGSNGKLVGVAEETIANAATGSVRVPGGFVISFPVKGHNGSANAAVTAGDKVYFTATEAFFDVDSSATFAGWALAGVSSGATTTVNVLLGNPIA